MIRSFFYVLRLFVITFFFCITTLSFVHSQKYDPISTDQKFISALQSIRMGYVDSVNEPKIVEEAIIGMLKALDPHSVYIPKEELDEANEGLVGNFEGIGVQFDILRDTILVVAAVPGGPSEQLGIQPGDRIVKIEGEDATGSKINTDYIIKKLRGKRGTKVTISIYRKERKGLIDYTITRDKIPLNSIDAAYMATPQTGYIKLNRFSRTTMNEFHTSLDTLHNRGMENLILDLRGNSGGYLTTAVDLVDEFLEKDNLIVYTEGINSLKQKYYATASDDFVKGKLIIMIDENSASASEIVAGAVQDWDRGIIIGRRSFGKGLVQKPYTLTDGSIIRLTTARYYTPTGRCIQKPYKDNIDKYYRDISNRYKNGELINPDSIHFPDSLKYFTPKKRVVYGGGGIMPDIFIPLDTARISDYYADLLKESLLTQFCLDYTTNNRENLLDSYPTLESFAKSFLVNDDFLKRFVDYSEKEGVEKDEEGFNISKKYIANQLKAIVARNLWNIGAYFEIDNTLDDAYLKALKIMGDDTFRKMKIQNK